MSVSGQNAQVRTGILFESCDMSDMSQLNIHGEHLGESVVEVRNSKAFGLGHISGKNVRKAVTIHDCEEFTVKSASLANDFPPSELIQAYSAALQALATAQKIPHEPQIKGLFKKMFRAGTKAQAQPAYDRFMALAADHATVAAELSPFAGALFAALN